MARSTKPTAATAVDAANDQLQMAGEVVRQMEANVERVRGQADRVRAERQKIALDAAQGDGAAKRRLDALTSESVRLGVDLENAEAAVRTAHERQAQAQEAVRVAEREQRHAEAERLAAEIQTLSVQFDEQAGQMAALLERRAALIAQLEKTGVPPAGVTTSMRSRGRVSRALWHAGLADYAEIPRIGASHRKSLTEVDTASVQTFTRPGSSGSKARSLLPRIQPRGAALPTFKGTG